MLTTNSLPTGLPAVPLLVLSDDTVLAADRLAGVPWRSVGGALNGNGEIASVTVQRQTTESQRFYRIRIETQ